MKSQHLKKWCGLLLLLALTYAPLGAFTSCSETAQERATTPFVPAAPDYTNATMWHTQRFDYNDNGADVFYIVSTWETDWTTSTGQVSHYADVWNAQHRADMLKEITGVAKYMGEGNNFYAPFYRHTTIEAWATQCEDTIRQRTQLAMSDIKAAWDYFVAHRQPGRPIILAGFSQGGLAVVELLKHMDDLTANDLAAAYVMGYKVTPDDTTRWHHIRPARRADDTGVTICYNTVKDVRYICPVISAPCAMCINPVNWQTDETPATLHDSITVRVDTTHHVLVVNGYSGSEYPPILGFLNVGDIHGCEPWLYSECLKQNIQLRTQAWRKLHGK